MPISQEFKLQIVARPEDIDELGHVSNIVYVRWIQDAATGHSSAVGFHHAAYVALGVVFVVHKHVIEYRAPAYAGDRITATTFIESWSAATSERHTRLVRDADGKELARAITTWAMISIDGGRPRRIPPQILDAFR